MRTAAKALNSSIAGALLLAGVSVLPTNSYAGDGGAVALGAIGGLAAGAMLGSALSGPRYYAPPPRHAYRTYYPAYAADYEECVQRRVWGPYGYRWITEC